MLRENLDTVLKYLLEFKKHEYVQTQYPGPRLDINADILPPKKNLVCHSVSQTVPVDIITNNSKEISNLTLHKNIYDINNVKENKSEIIHRIRRYLDKKSKEIKKSTSKIKNIFKNKKYVTKKDFNAYKKNVLIKPKDNNLKTRKRRTIHNLLRNDRFSERVKRKETLEKLILKLKQSHHKSHNDPAHGDAALKARFLFKSCMNHGILQKRGHQPLLDLLDVFGGWPILKPNWNAQNFDWLELMAQLRLYNNDILISEWVGPDIKNSDEFVIQFDQTSLGKYILIICLLMRAINK